MVFAFFQFGANEVPTLRLMVDAQGRSWSCTARGVHYLPISQGIRIVFWGRKSAWWLRARVRVRVVLTVLDKSRHFCSRNFSASLVNDLYYSLGLAALPLLLSFPRCVSTSACTRRTRCGQKYQRNLSGGGARYSNTSVGRRSRTSLCLNKACCGLLLY